MRIHALLIALFALIFAGCMEETNRYVLNPDGSGKVVHTAVMTPMNLDFGGTEKSPEAKMRSFIRGELEQCEGIEAWADVSGEVLEDGRTRFVGTAYFKNIAKVKFHNSGSSNNALDAPTLVTHDNGTLTLSIKSREGAKPGAPVEMSDEEIAAKIKEERTQFQAMKPMLAGFVAGLKSTTTLTLPGEVTSVSNFKTADDGTLSISLEGAKLIEVMEAMVADDEMMRNMILAGRSIKGEGPAMGEAMNEKLFGEKGPISITFTAGEAQFDYAAEVEAAHAATEAMLEKLGLGGMVVAAPAAGEGFESIRIGGIRLVKESDPENGIRPFNYDKGLAVSMIGTLPGSVLKVTEGKLETAIADNGEDLMPERDWDRKINFPNLSTDQATVVFDVSLRAPSSGAKGFSEISGTLEYLTSGTIDPVDLGFGKLAEGEKGQQFDAVIKSKGKSDWGDKQAIEISLALDSEAIESIQFFDKDGNELEASRSMSMGGGGSTTVTYNSDVAMPDDGRIVINVHGDLKKFTIPWEIRDVTLFGDPVGQTGK
jgi:hypothetical protein